MIEISQTNIILTVLSILWVVVIGLISYIIKKKDNAESSTLKVLDEIKLTTANTNNTLIGLSKDVENNIYHTRKLEGQLQVNTSTIHNIKINEVKLSSRVLALEKEIINVNKKKND